MRKPVDRPRLEEFMKGLGRLATSPGTICFTGGSTALLLDIRDQTVDIDIKLDPEPEGVFEAIAELKETLGLNVELASPDQFIPPLPGWRERSIPILTAGRVEFKHYDLYSQALAKIERGHALDLTDAGSFIARGLIVPEELERLFEAIRPLFIRYPAVDAGDLERRLRTFLRERRGARDEVRGARGNSGGNSGGNEEAIPNCLVARVPPWAAPDCPVAQLPGCPRPMDLAGLPGAELVLRGLEEVRGAEPTECALLVLIAAPRLRGLGLEVPERDDIPGPYEHQLYALLERTHGDAAYSRYGSLIRRIVSFSRSLATRT